MIINPACPKFFGGLVKMTLMLVTSHVHAGYSLHEGQAMKRWNSTTYISIIMTFKLLLLYNYTKYGDKSNERVHGIRPQVSVTKTQTLKTQTWDPETQTQLNSIFFNSLKCLHGRHEQFLSVFHIHRITKSEILHKWKFAAAKFH